MAFSSVGNPSIMSAGRRIHVIGRRQVPRISIPVVNTQPSIFRSNDVQLSSRNEPVIGELKEPKTPLLIDFDMEKDLVGINQELEDLNEIDVKEEQKPVLSISVASTPRIISNKGDAIQYRGYGKIEADHMDIELPCSSELTSDCTIGVTPIGPNTAPLSVSKMKDGKFTVYGNPCEFFWHVYL
jgi:hypothetical protein